jgi:Arc/MetJ-type ribon-helix-helix transcriptional regulator
VRLRRLMPNLVVRITEQEMAALEAAASRAGQSRSDYVREALALRESGPDHGAALEDHEKRLSALEQLAHGAM